VPIDLLNPVAPHPLNVGLVGWWLPLANGYGGSYLYDLLGLNHGTLTNGPTWATGPYGFGGLVLDGTNDYAPLPSSFPAITGNLTCACWFKTSANTRHIFGGYDLSSPFSGWGFGIGLGTLSNKLTFWSRSSGTPGWVASVASVNTGAWVHGAVSLSGTSASFYVNGVLDVVRTVQVPASYSGTKSLFASTTGTNSFSGSATDIRIYSRAVTDGEAWQLYDQGVRGNPDLLRQYRRRAVLLRDSGGGAPVTATPAAVTAAWAPQATSCSAGSASPPASTNALWAAQAASPSAGASASPTVVSASWALQGASAATSGASASPAAVDAVWAVQAPSVSAGGSSSASPASSSSPASSNATWAVQTPSASAGSSSTAAPAVLQLTSAAGSASASAGTRAAPAAANAAWAAQAASASTADPTTATPGRVSLAWAAVAPASVSSLAIPRDAVTRLAIPRSAVTSVRVRRGTSRRIHVRATRTRVIHL